MSVLRYQSSPQHLRQVCNDFCREYDLLKVTFKHIHDKKRVRWPLLRCMHQAENIALEILRVTIVVIMLQRLLEQFEYSTIEQIQWSHNAIY